MVVINTRYDPMGISYSSSAWIWWDGGRWRLVQIFLFNSCRLDVIKKIFSVKHRLHVLLPSRYGLTQSMISHDNIGVM